MKIALLTRRVDNPLYEENRFMEEAKARGHELILVDHAKCYVTIELDKPEVRYEGQDISDIDAIIPRIGASSTAYGTAIVRQFEMKGVYTTARSIAITRSRDKLRSLQLLSKSNVGIPKTIFARETVAVDSIIEQLSLPMIIKLAIGTHGHGVVLAETKKAAKSVIQAFYVNDTSILIQEYIEEANGSDIRALVVGNQVVGSYKRQSLDGEFRSNIHLGGTGTAIKLTDEERKAALRAAKAMGLAICGVDLIRSHRGPLVLEVNSSPGLKGIENVTGRNIAGKIIEYVEQNSKQRHRKDRVGA